MATAPDLPAITTLVPWFGSNRMLAENVGAALEGCEWVGVPFLGGGSELLHIKARTIVANDLHRQVINLAIILRNPRLGPMLIRDLRRIPFHADALAQAQEACAVADTWDLPFEFVPSYLDALNYFVASWMSRSAQAGTDGEFKGGLPVRWDAGGGDSAVRYRSAVEGLRAWRAVLARVNFLCMDCFEFLKKCKDRPGHGIYADPPFPGPGDGYKHKFTEAQHRQLATTLGAYREARIVCRFYRHPLIEELYPRDQWRWTEFAGRTQANAAAPEVLITNEREKRLF